MIFFRVGSNGSTSGASSNSSSTKAAILYVYSQRRTAQELRKDVSTVDAFTAPRSFDPRKVVALPQGCTTFGSFNIEDTIIFDRRRQGIT